LVEAPTLVLDCRLLFRILVDPSADTMKAEELAEADAAREKLKEAKIDSADNGDLIVSIVVVFLSLSSFMLLWWNYDYSYSF
jgi:hypothetical protein